MSNPIRSILEKVAIQTANDYGGFEGFDPGDIEDLDDAEKALTAYVEEERRLARIDELEKAISLVWDEDGSFYHRHDVPHQLIDRLNELKGKQSQDKGTATKEEL